MEKIDILVKEATEIWRSQRTEDPALSRAKGAGLSSQAPSCKNIVVGLDEVSLELKARLCGQPDGCRILSIIGMAGIGKTSLARSIYDDLLIREHFHTRAWVTVSQEYFLRGIFLGLISSMSAATDDLTTEGDDILAARVYKSLKGRKYLIVMDDMWSKKALDDIKRVLPDDKNGSRVIITTRLSEVAIHADSSIPPHEVQLLNEKHSWRLLQEKVFPQERCPVDLERIGKIIVGKCGGLPLAIVLVAGLLSKIGRTLTHWEKFAKDVSLTLATNDKHLFKILSLSYNNLPHHLRACFLYMGCFPEDSEIPITRLTKLWTAEGFLKPDKFKSLEEVAREYVWDLVKRNLISVTKKSSIGRIRYCRIHDLLRDFCIQKAHDENFLHVNMDGNTSQKGIENKRRLCSLTRDSIPSNPSSSLVRSILIFNKMYFGQLTISFRLLKVFSGTNVSLDLRHPAVTELFHLRYLSFSYTSIDFVVPATISNLRNLQTLILQPHCNFISGSHDWMDYKICLPSEIWKMPKLRHVIVYKYCLLPIDHLDKEIGGSTYVLENLQTLSKVGNFSFAPEIIEMIPNLKKLGVVYYNEHLIDQPNYYLHNLCHLYQLETLKICVALRSPSDHSLQSHLTQNFALPLSLKKLTLDGCSFSWENLSIVGRLPNLEVLKLRQRSVVGEEWHSVEGEFLRLKFLLMEILDVKCWQAESTHFPTLECLIIICCENLKEIPSGIGDIATLKSIEVVKGTGSARNSATRILEEQRISFENDSLRVHVHNQFPRYWFWSDVSII